MKKQIFKTCSRSNKSRSFWVNPFLRPLLLFTLILFSISKGMAQPIPKKALLALSKTDHILAIIDPNSLNILAKIPVGIDPHEVIASADGKLAFVTIYGGGSFHELNILDLVEKKALPSLDTKPFLGPHGLVFSDGKAWFTAEGSKMVASYDPALGQINWAMGTGQDRTHMIWVDSQGHRIYTSNVSSSTISILTNSLIQPRPFPNGFLPPDAKAHWEWSQVIIPVANGSEGFDVSPDGAELWAAGSENGIISIINTKTQKLESQIEAKAIGANRLKFTPDGKRVLITSLRNGDLFVFDAITHTLLNKINTGHGAAGILIEEDGSRAFIGCTADDYVAVLDLKSYAIIGHIPIAGADGLAWAIRP